MRYTLLLSLVIALFISDSTQIFAGEYQDTEKGVFFRYPDSMTIDNTNSRAEPFSLVFSRGTPPSNTFVVFRAVKGETLEAFIAQEHKDQQIGQYAGEVTEKKHDLANGLYAVEFIRPTPVGEIYYFVFSSPKTKQLYAFWHITSKIADPERKTLAAYREMIETLSITK